MKIIQLHFLLLVLLLSTGNHAMAKGSSMFRDTTVTGRIKVHHTWALGFVEQLGKQHMLTYNSFDNKTYPYNNNMVPQNARYLSFRFSHELMLKNILSAGITYGLDLYVPLHDVRAFVPLLPHISKQLTVARKLDLLFTQRAGYSFYLRSHSTDPFITSTGVSGGFTSESLAGFSIKTKCKGRFVILSGYRFQHLHSSRYFTPDPTLTQNTNLHLAQGRIKETSNAWYSFVYFTIGMSF